MVFNSYTFIIFFLIVLALHNLPFSWKVKKINLMAASYIFYAAWNPPFVLLLWITTIIDWNLARGIHALKEKRAKFMLLLFSLSLNLGLLSYFKYGNFLLENFTALAGSFGIEYVPPEWDIILPVGISFFTFQSLSYTLDVYRGQIKPSQSFWDYALYVIFFPQLVAGPIVRASDFLPQCVAEHKVTLQRFGWGISLFILGMFLKIVVADGFMAPIVDKVYLGAHAPNFTEAWLGTFAFAMQIFGDFAGYSTCAIGVALCLGFILPDNFRFPYAAVGFSDFWRRWHISLSTWLRDYLYISLGGNRAGAVRTSINLMLTMLLGGLWHGASWNFMIWGGLHGLYLVGERVLKAYITPSGFWLRWPVQIVLGLITFLLVCVAWVFFRAASFDQAVDFITAMLGLRGAEAPHVPLLQTADMAMVLAVTGSILTFHWLLRNHTTEYAAGLLPWWARSLVLAALGIMIMITSGDDRAFIYFQF